jgi:hypothetical protein
VESTTKAPEQVAQGGRRVILTAEATFIVASLCVLSTLIEGVLGFVNSLSRAVFPYANNQWSEAPLALELFRMAHGQPAFLSTARVNSYDYGPVYVYVLNAVRVLTGHPFDIVWFRFVTIAIGLLAILPLIACALALAARAGLTRNDRAGIGITVAVAVSAGLAVLSQGITFDSVHPDNISYLFIAAGLAIYYLIAGGRLSAPWSLAMVGCLFGAVFAKQSWFAFAPLLIAALWLSGRTTWRWAIGSFAGYMVALGVTFVALPHDMLAWIFKVPSAHLYQLNAQHTSDFIAFMTKYEPFLSVLLVLFPLAAIFIARKSGRRALWIDAAVLVGTLAVAMAGYFKALGAWNNLTLIGVTMVPYLATLLGVLVTQRILGAAPRPLAFAALFLVLAVPLGLSTPPKAIPDDQTMATMRGLAAAADALCKTGKPIAVTVYPDLFFNCPNASNTLFVSFEELRQAYPRYYAGPTDDDLPPTATYAVGIDNYGLSPAWSGSYTEIRRIPGVIGWGAGYFPVHFQIFKLKGS